MESSTSKFLGLTETTTVERELWYWVLDRRFKEKVGGKLWNCLAVWARL